MLTSLVLAGFKGLYLDRFGYADRGRALENDLKEILHQQPLVSQNQRLVFFDLSEYERSLRSRLGIIEWQLRREEELIPLAVYPAWQGFGPLEGTHRSIGAGAPERANWKSAISARSQEPSCCKWLSK